MEVFDGHMEDCLVDSVTEGNVKKVITFDGRFGGGYISERLKFIEGMRPKVSIIYLLG